MLFSTEELTDADVLRDRVQEAATYMRTHQASGMFLVCLDHLSGAAEDSLFSIMAREKLAPAIPMTGMAGNILPLEGPVHPELRFVRISEDQTIQLSQK
jgi:hypothetical protein